MKRFNPRRVKIHRSYAVDEAAECWEATRTRFEIGSGMVSGRLMGVARFSFGAPSSRLI